ncbi:conserved hypothetical protein [Vibrio chagasii]|nr:conserved hypothetical protein [Vibrio chagasii]CAH6958949.1 conserved hypothetical protein [Vibrio chagasii]
MSVKPFYQSNTAFYSFELVETGGELIDELVFKFKWPKKLEVVLTSEMLMSGSSAIVDFTQSLKVPINSPETDEFVFVCRFMNKVAFHKDGVHIRYLDKHGGEFQRWNCEEWVAEPSKMLSVIRSIISMC